jgi:hypothetical protein
VRSTAARPGDYVQTLPPAGSASSKQRACSASATCPLLVHHDTSHEPGWLQERATAGLCNNPNPNPPQPPPPQAPATTRSPAARCPAAGRGPTRRTAPPGRRRAAPLQLGPRRSHAWQPQVDPRARHRRRHPPEPAAPPEVLVRAGQQRKRRQGRQGVPRSRGRQRGRGAAQRSTARGEAPRQADTRHTPLEPCARVQCFGMLSASRQASCATGFAAACVHVRPHKPPRASSP